MNPSAASPENHRNAYGPDLNANADKIIKSLNAKDREVLTELVGSEESLRRKFCSAMTGGAIEIEDGRVTGLEVLKFLLDKTTDKETLLLSLNKLEKIKRLYLGGIGILPYSLSETAKTALKALKDKGIDIKGLPNLKKGPKC